MKKKTAVILAVLLIASIFVFTGCGNDDQPLNDGTQGSMTDDIKRGVDDIGDGVEKGLDDIGDDLTGNKTDGSAINNNDRAGNVDNGVKNNAN